MAKLVRNKWSAQSLSVFGAIFIIGIIDAVITGSWIFVIAFVVGVYIGCLANKE